MQSEADSGLGVASDPSLPPSSPVLAPPDPPDSPASGPAQPLVLRPPIVRVVVHPGMALVERALELPRDVPLDVIQLEDLPPVLQEGSLQVRLEEAPWEVASLAFDWILPGQAKVDPQPLERAAEEALRRIHRLERKRRGLESQLSFWLKLRPQVFDPSTAPSTPSVSTDIGPLTTATQSWTTAMDVQQQRLEHLQAAMFSSAAELEAAREAERLASARLEAARGGRLEGVPRRVLTLNLAPVEGGSWGASPRLVLAYLVGGATWQPAYEVRAERDGSRAELRLRAHIAQATGEDWTGVALSVSTADARYVTELPKLQALRIGRAQPPAMTGWRPPPEGLETLFEGYDRDRPASPIPAHSLRKKARTRPKPPEPELSQLDSGDADWEEDGGGMGMDRVAAPARSILPPTMIARSTSVPRAPVPPPSPAMLPPGAGGGAFEGGFGGPPALPSAVPSASMAARDVDAKKGGAPLGGSSPSRARGGGGPQEEASAPPPAPLEAGGDWLAFDALRLGGADSPARGRLRQLDREALLEEALPVPGALRQLKGQLSARRNAQTAVLLLPLPSFCTHWNERRERFDHRLDASHPLDVPSDGRWHVLTLRQAKGESSLRYTATPALEPVVYRELRLKNPLNAPLLSGPCELYLGGELVATSRLEQVGRGGQLILGLGVEERIRVARNLYFKEIPPGMLSRTLGLEHDVQLSLSSQLETPVTVDVLERVPITEADDVEIRELLAQPSSQPYDQQERGQKVKGGRCLSVTVPARGQAQARLTWRVNIHHTHELLGGNRRE